MTREQLIKYTAKNPYEQFPDGRPKVADAVLEKLKDMSSEEIGLSQSGFPNQFVDKLQPLRPGKELIGRAATPQLMPLRPDIADVDRQNRSSSLFLARAGRIARPLILLGS